MQRALFVGFLRNIGMGSKASIFSDESKVPVERVKMPWRDSKNKKDCGIYVMRHMETFKGKSDWKSDLKKGAKQQMNNLRVKYVYEILTHQINELSVQLQREWGEEKKKKMEEKKTKKLQKGK